MKLNFIENKPVYLGVVIFFSCAAFIIRSPFYEAFIDVSVSPPENIRKTDFSWITVNEWFNSQKYIITSYAMLKKAQTGIDEEVLKKIIFVKRVGAADIIRISAMADYKPEMLANTVDMIANAYVSTLNRSVVTDEKDKWPAEGKDLNDVISAYIKEIKSLSDERESFENKLKSATEYEALCDSELNRSFVGSGRAKEISDKISNLDAEILKLTHRSNFLKEQYTDNWPEMVDLNSKIDWMRSEKTKLVSELDSAVKYDEKKGMLSVEMRIARVASDGYQKQLDLLQAKLEDLEGKKNAAEARLEPVKSASFEVSDTGFTKKEGAFILNPPAINLLPDLWLQLIEGSFTGLLIWAAINAILRSRKKN
ncbi:MAG: hypothetical protein NTZ95_04105 [Candidatus Omnitrophica bacterium]|nr:hypothetical protein [Candidatus Omnitrophota bacterium]